MAAPTEQDLAHTASWYARASSELAGTSALQSAWAAAIAEDADAVAAIARMPRPSRAPSLVFSVARLLGAPAVGWADGYRAWLLAHTDALAVAADGRRVQTNEVQRCVPLVLGLARIPGPLAILELGAAAGLCLLADRYAYEFGGAARLGAGSPVLRADVIDLDPPSALPDIVWRRGIDLHPLDAADPDDRAWLDALLPPDRPDRATRLAAACATASAHPLDLRTGDAADALVSGFDGAPADATRVVVSLGTLVYLPVAARERVRADAAAAGARLLAFEPVATLPDVASRAAAGRAAERTGHVLSLDGVALAYGSAHGDRMLGIVAG